MGAHIIRRSPVSLLQQAERRPTTELTKQQLHALIDPSSNDRLDPPQANPHGDLEAELELIDALPDAFPDATPESLPRFSLPRLAHTMRRDLKSGGVPTLPALPALHDPDDRIDVSTILMPRQARPATPAPGAAKAGSSARPGDELPSTERPTQPAIPRPLVPGLTTAEADPPTVVVAEESLTSDVAATEPAPASVTPKQPRQGVVLARLVLPVVAALLALGAGTIWLLQ